MDLGQAFFEGSFFFEEVRETSNSMCGFPE
jgi:hypothetical protein